MYCAKYTFIFTCIQYWLTQECRSHLCILYDTISPHRCNFVRNKMYSNWVYYTSGTLRICLQTPKSMKLLPFTPISCVSQTQCKYYIKAGTEGQSKNTVYPDMHHFFHFPFIDMIMRQKQWIHACGCEHMENSHEWDQRDMLHSCLSEPERHMITVKSPLLFRKIL